MSTLDGPIWSKRSIALTCPARSHFQCTQSKEKWGHGTAHQENEETKKGKRAAGEKRKQATNLKEAVCCPSAAVQGAA